MTVHIQVLGWNRRAQIGACLRSCLAQSIHTTVLYVDNGSSDGSVEFVRETFPEVRVHANTQNRGFSGGHNDGMRAVPDTEVVVVLDPDVVLEPDFLAKGLAAFARPSVGAVAPLLLRGDGSPGMSTAAVVDAYGTRLLSSLRAVNQYEGIPLSVVPQPMPPPWGFTGAAVFLRRTALLDVAIQGEIFDEHFFTYREDVDLSWRLRLRGWAVVGAPEARAHHVRTTRAGKRKSARVAQLSWRNYYLTLVKDVPLGTLLRHGPAVLLEALARDLHLVFTPSLWVALPEMLRLLPRMLFKREKVIARASAALYAAGDVPWREGKFPDGRIDYHHAAAAPVLSCVVRRGEEILLLKRSDRVGSYKGWWHVVGGYLDEPMVPVEKKALLELQEELGIPKDAVGNIQTREPFEVFDPDVAKTWQVHPVLVEVTGDPPIRLDWEHTEYRWVRPSEVPSYHPIPSVPGVLRRLSVIK